jgi:nitroreductase
MLMAYLLHLTKQLAKTGNNKHSFLVEDQMNKKPETSAPLTELLEKRWSPRAYDANHLIEDKDILSILEAGRWAPSANNGQPWRFSVAVRGTDVHAKVTEGLGGFNQAWAPTASAMIVISIKKNEDGTSSVKNFYDAGLAVSLMTVQAQSLDLYSHQMAGIVPEVIQESLAIPAEFEVAVVVAIGKVASPDVFEGAAYEREIAPRARLPLEEIVLHGKP